ncbi:MAG: peptidase T, partial [Lachnospiraceae bacterium]
TSMSGDVAAAQMHYFVRDHDQAHFEARKDTLRLIEKNLNAKWGEGTVKLTITEQYKNMACIIADCMHLIENAKLACETVDVEPLIRPIRGGTDGCQLSFKGLPCPNLGTGGHGYHGPYEHISIEGMDKATDVAVEIVKLYAK